MTNAHLNLAQAVKVQDPINLILERISRRTTTPAPQIIARVGHLEQARIDGPHYSVRSSQGDLDVAGYTIRTIGCGRAFEVEAHGDGVHEEREGCGGEYEVGWPEDSVGGPGVLAIAEHLVLGVVVGYEGVEHGSKAVSRHDCAEESNDEVESLHVALEYLLMVMSAKCR